MKGRNQLLIGDALENINNYSGLYYRIPFEKVHPFISLFFKKKRISCIKLGYFNRLGSRNTCLGTCFFKKWIW
jgi:hypothetical protein